MAHKSLNEDEQLAAAIRIASSCHEMQYDKNGAPYVLHPLRMLNRAIVGGQSRSIQIVAVLHDALEDCPDQWTQEELAKAGFSSVVRDALDHVTKRPDEAGKEQYFRFVDRICKAEGEAGRVARRVKLLDLEDNMDILRYGSVDEKVFHRLKRYHDAHKKVLAAIAAKDA
jgi:(p)ppGpp synthase/HD superfamily hydrolase